jgi:hypothetical protein
MYVCMHVWLAGEHIIMAVLVLQGIAIKRMSAPVQRGGGVCSARIRQVANTARRRPPWLLVRLALRAQELRMCAREADSAGTCQIRPDWSRW